MKILTVRQPFAQHIVTGAKTIENRTQRTLLRGRIGIHAGKAPHALALPSARIAIREGRLPVSAVVGTVQLVGCHEAEPGCCTLEQGGIQPGELGYARDATVWHWELDGARQFASPILRVQGALSFWEPDDRTAHLMSIAEVLS